MQELDDLLYATYLTANRLCLVKETHPDDAMRKQAVELVKKFQDWSVSLDYREDVYQTIRAYADTRPNLKGEDKRLFEDTLRDYRRAGLHLPPTEKTKSNASEKNSRAPPPTLTPTSLAPPSRLNFPKQTLMDCPKTFWIKKTS